MSFYLFKKHGGGIWTVLVQQRCHMVVVLNDSDYVGQDTCWCFHNTFDWEIKVGNAHEEHHSPSTLNHWAYFTHSHPFFKTFLWFCFDVRHWAKKRRLYDLCCHTYIIIPHAMMIPAMIIFLYFYNIPLRNDWMVHICRLNISSAIMYLGIVYSAFVPAVGTNVGVANVTVTLPLGLWSAVSKPQVGLASK